MTREILGGRGRWRARRQTSHIGDKEDLAWRRRAGCVESGVDMRVRVCVLLVLARIGGRHSAWIGDTGTTDSGEEERRSRKKKGRRMHK